MSFDYNFRKQRHPRTLGKKLIIGCEGKETERLYFNAIRIDLRIPKDRIKVSFNGSSPVSVVDNVIAIKAEMSRKTVDGEDFDPADGDEAWAVFDGDEHIRANLAGWKTALQRAGQNDIKLAISNPAFELWLLLHFQDQTANIDRVQARRALKAHLPDYEKNRDFYSTHLQDRTGAAIRRATALDVSNGRNGNLYYHNPSSGVHQLVTTLLSLSDKD